jgi:hypothetical protein
VCILVIQRPGVSLTINNKALFIEKKTNLTMENIMPSSLKIQKKKCPMSYVPGASTELPYDKPGVDIRTSKPSSEHVMHNLQKPPSPANR